ncbi:50S ribosomal protein L5 [Neisseria meningitidis]|nr:50S ribosomal protein L5 [Neisseria meningitidis]
MFRRPCLGGLVLYYRLIFASKAVRMPKLHQIIENMGVREQIIFPEIEYDKIDALRGLNITITTTAKTDEEAKALLSLFKFPFKG